MTTEQFLQVIEQAAREKTGAFAVVISQQDRLRLGTTPMMPVRPSLNPIVLNLPRR